MRFEGIYRLHEIRLRPGDRYIITSALKGGSGVQEGGLKSVDQYTDYEAIERAFEKAKPVLESKYGMGPHSELTIDVKRLVVQLYEEATGETLLEESASEESQPPQQGKASELPKGKSES